MRLAYLYSRYPVLSQTFCDTEMLELERNGFRLLICSIHPPHTSMRHAHAARLQAPTHYAPPQPILRRWEEKMRAEHRWPEALIEAHERNYGARSKSTVRARNAAYFADLFQRNAIDHFHVHFTNRAAHTALFLKEMSGIPFSVTAHGQDFMVDMESDELLREICDAAEFVAVETDCTRGLLCQRCPEATAKIHRVYNGMDLANFAHIGSDTPSPTAIRFLSVGRLVPFKGFQDLLQACTELRRRGLDFSCEIIGEGPQRQSLQKKIDELGLGEMVTLSGALPQELVLERMRNCDVFVLASVVDREGASDIFPTVILEAMAAGRPVVATRLGGISEAVADGKTALLVPPGDIAALADALERFGCDPSLRFRYGAAGRLRIEEQFQIEITIRPMIELLTTLGPPAEQSRESPAQVSKNKQIVYLIDSWPDERLPALEIELLEMQQRNIAVTAFVCQFLPETRMTGMMMRLATQMEYLPDAMVLEAEWEANRETARLLEEERRYEEHRPPSAVFLEQARFALVLRRLILDREISHVHATSSRALLCGVMLKRMTGVTLSATIEAKPELSRDAVQNALVHCVGGRISDRKLSARLSSAFLLEPSARTFRLLKTATGINLTGRATWQEWAELLVRWSRQET